MVGFTNVNPQTGVIAGQAGIEQEYNKLLTGTTGSEKYQKGADGVADPRDSRRRRRPRTATRSS